MCACMRASTGARVSVSASDTCAATAAPTIDDGGGVRAYGRVCLHERAVCPEQRAVSDGESLLRTTLVSIASTRAQ